MKIQKTELNFGKSSIIELNEPEMDNVKGGTFSASFSGHLCDWVIDKLTNPL